MKESVLDILIYLFENYMLENTDNEPNEESIMVELIQAGFNHLTIDSAFDWLENLALMCDEQNPNSGSSISEHAMRHYDADEIDQLSLETRGLLLSLEQIGILSPRSRELVIDRLMALEVEDIDLNHVKWVILMVLSNCSGESSSNHDWTQALLLDNAHFIAN